MKCVSAIVIINFSRSVFPKSRGSTSPLTPLARDLQRNYQFCTNFEKVVPSGGGGGWGGGGTNASAEAFRKLIDDLSKTAIIHTRGAGESGETDKLFHCREKKKKLLSQNHVIASMKSQQKIRLSKKKKK